MTSTEHRGSRHMGTGRRARAVRSRLLDERGAALLEFVLVLPVVLLVLLGIAQFGLALNSANDATSIASETARYATVNENPGEAKKESLAKWAKSQADTNFLVSGGKVCIRFPNGTTIGNPVEVVVEATQNWFPILKLKKLSSPIVGRAVMRLEAPPSTYGAECA